MHSSIPYGYGFVFAVAALGACGGTSATTPSDSSMGGSDGTAPGVNDGSSSSSDSDGGGATTGDAGGIATGIALDPRTCKTPSRQVSGIDGSAIAGVLECSNVVYDPVVNVTEVELDLYVPPGYVAGSHSPAIIYVHGGGWKSGAKEEVGPHEYDYLKRGYFVLSLNYRLSSAGSTTHPVDMTTGAPPVNATAIQDVKTAIQFIRANYASFIDTSRLIGWGFSAGGHLVVLAGVSSNDEATHPELKGRSPGKESTALSAVVAQSPVLDLDLYVANPLPQCGSLAVNPALCGTVANPIPNKCTTDPQCTSSATCTLGDEYGTIALMATEAMLGTAIASPPTGVTYSSTSLGFVNAGDPPIYMLAGKCDGTVPTVGAQAFGPAAKSQGGDVTVKLVETAGHQETMDPSTNPTGDSDVKNWLTSKTL